MLSAIAFAWNSTDVWVVCPWCGCKHVDLGPPILPAKISVCAYTKPEKKSRIADAVSIGRYQITFPFETHESVKGLGIEIDHDAGVFRTVGLETSGEIPDCPGLFDTARLNKDLESLDLEDEDDLVVVSDYDDEDVRMPRSRLTIRACTTGDLDRVKDLCEDAPTETVVDWRDRCSVYLRRAAISGHDHIVKYFHEEGIPKIGLNTTDTYGRTPLMEAALFGRVSVVQYLQLKKATQDLRDKKGYTALDLARFNPRNNCERRHRASNLEEPDYRDEHYQVAVLLGLHSSKRAPDELRLGGLETTRFHKTGRAISILSAMITHEVWDADKKTMACLERGSPFPLVSAISGWTSSGPPPRISGEQWTSMSLDLYNTLELPKVEDKRHDQGVKGRAAASHAEQQLMAYFLHHHVLDAYSEKWPIVPDGLLQGSAFHSKKTPMLVIAVNRPPCTDCERMKDRIADRFDVLFNFQLLPNTDHKEQAKPLPQPTYVGFADD